MKHQTKPQRRYRQALKSSPTKENSIALGLPGGEFLDLCIQLGLESFRASIDAAVTNLVGPRYSRAGERTHYRWGHRNVEVHAGGRKASIQYPRVRAAGGKEIALPELDSCRNLDALLARVLEQTIVGVSNRKYERSLECSGMIGKERGASKSAVSRNFIAISQAKMEAWMTRKLEPEWPILMIDGKPIKGQMILSVLGVDLQGEKDVLGARGGSSENSRVCLDLLQDLVERGLDPEKVRLVVVDGSRALRKAIAVKFGDKVLVQRCQVHKMRNVLDYVSKKHSAEVKSKMSAAYANKDYTQALDILTKLADSLERQGETQAANSLREGLEETLTVVKLGCKTGLRRTLASTNLIENINGSVERVCGRVRRWRNADMAIRWFVTGLIEAGKGFRKVNGKNDLTHLMNAIDNKGASNEAA